MTDICQIVRDMVDADVKLRDQIDVVKDIAISIRVEQQVMKNEILEKLRER